MLNSSYDKIGLNLKFERALVLVLENILGPSGSDTMIVIEISLQINTLIQDIRLIFLFQY